MEPTLGEAIERLRGWWSEQSWAEVNYLDNTVEIDGSVYDIVGMAMAALDIPEPPK